MKTVNLCFTRILATIVVFSLIVSCSKVEPPVVAEI